MASSAQKPDAPASPGLSMNESRSPEQNSNDAVTISSAVRPPLRLSIANKEEWTARALRFLASASNEMLGSIALGLALCTYLVLGRLGLVLIGVLGGITLHATWEGSSALAGDNEHISKEKSLDVVKRVLDWRGKQAVDYGNEEIDNDGNAILGARGFEDFRPETSVALSDFVEAVIRDYVRWWYKPIVPTDESFPTACRNMLTAFLRSISTHLSRKRPADTFLDFLTNSSSIVIVFLNEISSATSNLQGIGVLPADAVEEYLMSNPTSNLANIMNEKEQKKKFEMIAEDILQNFVENSAFKCNAMKIFLQEILASVVMETSLSTCSKAEWINGWIVYLLEEGEPELNQAIDVGMGASLSNDAEVNSGNVNSARSSQNEQKRHRKRLSKAEEAMEEAMEEVKRLSQMIAEEDIRKLRVQETPENNKSSSNMPRKTGEEKSALDPLFTVPRDVNNLNGKAEESVAKIVTDQLLPEMSRSGTGSSFTSFDQIVPASQPTALQADHQSPVRSYSLTLHNANIVIHDDSSAGEKGRIRTKPTGEYLVQIEPKASHGWIVVRKFDDFETLHEVLRRLANISGVAAFTEQHSSLPDWKTHTKASLRGELERYLRDACWHQQLAESEGMKRFLEKDQANAQSSGSKAIGWPTPAAFESMGKGLLDALASAPKGAADGGKAVFGGMTGVLGNIGSLGQRKRDSVVIPGAHVQGRLSTSTLPRLDSPTSISGARWGMNSQESLKSSPVVDTQPTKIPPMERKPSYPSIPEPEPEKEAYLTGRVSLSSRSSVSGRTSTSNSRDASRAPSATAWVSLPNQIVDVENIVLPPLPSDIPDDYGVSAGSSSLSHSRTESIAGTSRTSTSTAPSLQSPNRPSLSASTRPILPQRPRKEAVPLTEPETRVAVELLFAVINELYTLSSAWNIRRTLLAAAKAFLLRPSNPSFASIQSLLQDSVIASNASDAGIAAHLRKLRENTLPTPEELRSWSPPITAEEREKLRFRARKLLLERGLPAALTGVMGQAATSEAMGKVFDCLQIEEVARGLMFGLLLQGMKALAH